MITIRFKDKRYEVNFKALAQKLNKTQEEMIKELLTSYKTKATAEDINNYINAETARLIEEETRKSFALDKRIDRTKENVVIKRVRDTQHKKDETHLKALENYQAMVNSKMSPQRKKIEELESYKEAAELETVKKSATA